MNLPADEPTSAATQRLQQALYKAAFWRAARPELGWVLMTATPMDQPLAEARRRRIIRTAQVGFSVAIVVAIFSPTPSPSSPATESWGGPAHAHLAQHGLLLGVVGYPVQRDDQHGQ